ncbi:MAG: hypothetical protein K8T90_09485 [Planctomycetes bacterium]|nr:hypothetical protein [Planctomycetota bacterium]
MTAPSRAELLLDTDRAAAGLGMRSAMLSPRQLVFRHGPHQLEILAPDAGAERAARFVWGQLVAGVEAPCADTGVAWLDGTGVVRSETVTDEFGEFRLAAPADEGGLRIDCADGSFVCWVPPSRRETRCAS